MKNNVLYQIKTLEKIIFRNFCSSDLMERNLNKFHVTPTQMQIIEYILDHENKDIYQKDLENVLLLRRATVSGVLQTMEKNNLIERVVDKEDTRTKKITLNENTKEVFLKNREKIENLEKIATQDIDEADLEIFVKVVEKMKENIKNSSYC